MEYKATATNGKLGVMFTILIEDSGAFDYGNGKHLVLWDHSICEEKSYKNQRSFDIRYDQRYRKNNEIGYIKTFLEDDIMADEWRVTGVFEEGALTGVVNV